MGIMGKVASGAVVAAAVAACGGGSEIIAIVSFIGSAGGDWVVDDASRPGFQRRSNCGAAGNFDCVINIQPLRRSLFSASFGASFTGTLPGCPGTARDDGTISGDRITLPGCFTGRYVTINEALSDDATIRAYFDSELPDLRTGVWVEIQQGVRRFKFTSDPVRRTTSAAQGCELTSPTRTPVQVTVTAADLQVPRLQTTIDAFTVGGQTWTGQFVGISGMRLTRGTEVLELQRQDLPGSC